MNSSALEAARRVDSAPDDGKPLRVNINVVKDKARGQEHLRGAAAINAVALAMAHGGREIFTDVDIETFDAIRRTLNSITDNRPRIIPAGSDKNETSGVPNEIVDRVSEAMRAMEAGVTTDDRI